MIKLSVLENFHNKMSLALWNVKNLEPPPRNTFKAKNQDLDIRVLHEVLTEAFSTFKDQQLLHEEAALLSRCIYRMKLKFRSDKGLKEMEKMNRALLQYLRMNIPQALETFCSMVPQQYTRDTYLPTLNMLHYLLVRIQGLSLLMIRVVDSAKAAAQYMELRISIGHLWKVALVCLGIISRIFVLTKEITRYCCKFYSQLLPFTLKLKNVGSNWLPSDYSLPQDLKSWLNIDWLDKDETPVEKPKKITFPAMFDIADSDDDVEFCGEYTEIQEDVEITDEYVQVDEERNPETIGIQQNTAAKGLKTNEENVKPFNSQNKQFKTEKYKLYKLEMDEDLGEVIRASDKDKKINSKRKPNKRNVKHPKVTTNLGNETARQLISKINTLNDLKKFEEDFQGIQKSHSNIFKRMDRLQINTLHSSVKKWTCKAKKHHSDHKKLNFCISKAKEVLKSNLM